MAKLRKRPSTAPAVCHTPTPPPDRVRPETARVQGRGEPTFTCRVQSHIFTSPNVTVVLLLPKNETCLQCVLKNGSIATRGSLCFQVRNLKLYSRATEGRNITLKYPLVTRQILSIADLVRSDRRSLQSITMNGKWMVYKSSPKLSRYLLRRLLTKIGGLDPLGNLFGGVLKSEDLTPQVPIPQVPTPQVVKESNAIIIKETSKEITSPSPLSSTVEEQEDPPVTPLSAEVSSSVATAERSETESSCSESGLESSSSQDLSSDYCFRHSLDPSPGSHIYSPHNSENPTILPPVFCSNTSTNCVNKKYKPSRGID